MSSRTVLSTSCNYYVVLAAGIFNWVYGSIGLASRFGSLRIDVGSAGSRVQIRHHWGSPTFGSGFCGRVTVVPGLSINVTVTLTPFTVTSTGKAPARRVLCRQAYKKV
jgi:hypothetical protein